MSIWSNLSIKQRSGLVFSLLILVSIGLIVSGLPYLRDFRSLAATLGPNPPGNVVNNTSAGTIAWSSPGNAVSSNNTYASAVNSSSSNFIYTQHLRATSFNFSIPIGATINGIEVKIEQRADHLQTTNAEDWEVYILKGGAVVGTNHAYHQNIPFSESPWTYGGSTDRWGSTWTYADINSSDFGVTYRGELNGQVTLQVDYITIIVYYTPPTPPADTTDPSVSISSPSNGSTVSGTQSFGATATDNVGVTSLVLKIDGSTKKTCSSAACSYSWDTTTYSNGSHTLVATAADAAGNSGSDTHTVTVSNSTAPPPDDGGGGGSSGGGSSGGGSSGGGTTPSPIAGVPTLPPAPAFIPGTPVKIDPKIVNFLKISLNIPYLAGTIKVPFLIGGFGQEVEVSPGTKDYEIDVRGAKFKLGSQLKIQAGGSHTLLTKKITIKSKAPKQPAKFGDLWLGDLKSDNQVNFQDTNEFLSAFLEEGWSGDVNADGIANSLDWAVILANFGKRGD